MTPAFENRSGIDPLPLTFGQVARAKRLMRRGMDLFEVAIVIGVRTRDLDVALWQSLGNIPEGW